MTAGKYFNRNVLALDDPHIVHVIRNTYLRFMLPYLILYNTR